MPPRIPLRTALARRALTTTPHQAPARLQTRHASSGPRPIRSALSSTLLLVGGVAFVAYYYDSRSLIHEHLAMPLVRLLDPETGHKLAVKVLGNWWLSPKDRGVDGEELRAELFGLPLANPIGVAAGFDKDADAIDGLFDLGFGYVEVGSVTPEPQPGNPTPRFFRLMEDSAAINRYGFKSLGHAHTLAQLRARLLAFSRSHPSLFPHPPPASPSPPSGINLPRSLRPGHLLGVNLGKNKTSPADSNDDYIRGMRALGPYADVVVINVSSPNTPGLRALQGREILQRLLADVVRERDAIKVDGLPKIAVKVASDLSEDELADVAAAVRRSGVDGVIMSNTTVRREGLGLQSEHANQVGGLSGKPLFPYALAAVRSLRPLLPASIPIIGCGGVSSGEDALQMARAGASLVQVYTSFGLRGVGTPRMIKDEVTRALSTSGAAAAASWKASIGAEYGAKGSASWGQDKLEADGKTLRQEAADLGAMLRKAWQEDDTARLIDEAEAALGLGKRKLVSAIKGEKKGSNTDGPGAGARDNLAGAPPGSSASSERGGASSSSSSGDVKESSILSAAGRLLEGSSTAPASRPSSSASSTSVNSAPTVTTSGASALLLPGHQGEPIGSALGPLVVPTSENDKKRAAASSTSRADEPTTGLSLGKGRTGDGVPVVDQPGVGLDSKGRDAWRDKVKESDRRLV